MARPPLRCLTIVLLAVIAACSPQNSERLGGRTKTTDSIPFDTLLARLRAGSPGVRELAATDLAQPGPRVEEQVAALGEALHDTNIQVSSTAAWALGQLGAPALPVLVKGVKDKRPDIRYNSVYALGKLGQAAAPAGSVVKDALLDPDETVRKIAAWAMGQMAPQASAHAGGAELGSLADLAAGLKAPHPMERLNAVRRYQSYMGDPDQAVPLLIRALGDADPHVRGAAGDALVDLGAPAQAALSAALSDTSAVLRQEASVTLVRLSGKLH
jgi:HEAT repeat protein